MILSIQPLDSGRTINHYIDSGLNQGNSLFLVTTG